MNPEANKTFVPGRMGSPLSAATDLLTPLHRPCRSVSVRELVQEKPTAALFNARPQSIKMIMAGNVSDHKCRCMRSYSEEMHLS